MDGDRAQVLFSTEAEAYVESLETYNVKEIGSPRWCQQHERLEKLNMQAVLNAAANEDEFVKEYLITHEKLSVLIHELIATEVWKEKIFPEFIKQDLEPKVIFPVYMVMYHEATIINLLETVLYHREACESAEDCILDLADYCCRKIAVLLARMTSEEEEEEEEEESNVQNALAHVNSLEELQRQQKVLDFDICMKAVSILRYMTDHISVLPLSATTRLLNIHDVPILMVQLVENPPWTKNKDGKLLKYIDSKWQEVADADRFKMTKIEGQVWIALYQLLMDEGCQRKYELTSHRKNTILKLRSHLTGPTLDQLPLLAEMQRYLEQLSFMDPPPTKTDLILEQIPEMKEKLLGEHSGKWARLAKKQIETYFNPDKVDMKAQARRLAETYNFDVLENLITEPPKCALCGELATKRCSRCQNEWYCRRECQVKHWKKHKQACDLLVNALQKIRDQGDTASTQQASS